jgi:hypothetical protein
MLRDLYKQFLALAFKWISFSSLVVGFSGFLGGFIMSRMTLQTPRSTVSKVTNHFSTIIWEVGAVEVWWSMGIHPLSLKASALLAVKLKRFK